MSSYRETLQRVAEQTLIDPEAFTQLDRRRRRRHRNRRIVAAAVALAVAAAGTWGAIALVNVGRQAQPASSPRLRTATANGITVTFPSDWTLVELGRAYTNEGTHDAVPRFDFFQLTNYQPGLNPLFLCPGNVSIPPTGVLLYVHAWPGVPPGKPQPWPVAPVLTQLERGACGPGHYLDWSVGFRKFQAVILFGPKAPSHDRSALLATFRSMDFRWFDSQSLIYSIPAAWDMQTRQMTEELLGTYKDVLASVTSGGRRFTISMMPLELFKGEGPTLVLENGDIGPIQPPGPGEAMIATRYSNNGQLHIVVGSVRKHVARVDVVTGGRTYRATLVDFPREFPGAYRGYFFNLDGIKVNGGQIVARDSRGHVLQSLPLF